MTTAAGADYDEDQRHLVHRLPEARVRDRIPFLIERCTGRRVAHVGFADTGYREQNRREGRWLHEHLSGVTSSLVGLDVDQTGVDVARELGYVAHAVDCTDPVAVADLDLEAVDVVVAGEVIEHLDAPGPFLDAMHLLCGSSGRLVLTTPNACGWVNPLAALAGYEVNHPDHLVMFTQRTLTAMLERHGWVIEEVAVFVPRVNAVQGGGVLAVLGWLARALVAVQRVVARFRPFTADGLIVVARRASSHSTS